MIFFTADTHFYHENICEYSHRPFSGLPEMTEQLIERWNSVVSGGDIVYHLGDFALTNNSSGPMIDELLQRLKGTKFLVPGNHDRKSVLDSKFWAKVTPYHEIKIDFGEEHKQRVVLCHYAMRVWNQNHRGAWMLHGHCMDKDSEILTDDGWKTYSDISVGQSLPTYNHETGSLETGSVEHVHVFPEYTGEVVSLSGKSSSFRVTSEHRVVIFSRDGKHMNVIHASSYAKSKKRTLMRASQREFSGLDWTDDEIRLYVLLAADGSVKWETNLCRVHLWKDRKKEFTRKILNGMGYAYKELIQMDGSSSFNFYLPEKFYGMKIKGSDSKLDLMTSDQFAVFLDAYSQTDGCRDGKGSIIYSSKEDEVDQIQAMAVQRGYGATKSSRVNGFSTRPGFQLSIFPAGFSIAESSGIEKSQVNGELFWCITCTNSNFFMRHDGKVHLTGNSHGNLSDIGGKTVDVGVDVWDYTPVSATRIHEFMHNREIKAYDHHR